VWGKWFFFCCGVVTGLGLGANLGVALVCIVSMAKERESNMGRIERFLQGLTKLSKETGLKICLYDAVDEGFVLEAIPEGREVEYYRSYVYGTGQVVGSRQKVKEEIDPVCTHRRCELFNGGEGEPVCEHCQYRERREG